MLPGESQTQAYGVHKERVQTHAGSLCVGNVGHKAHHQGADDGSNDGGQEHGTPRHELLLQTGSAAAKSVGVDHDDVSHGEEGRQTGHHFRTKRGAVFL